jgi:hypothetical protein
MTLVKAKLANLDSGDEVEVLFNPTEYSFSKSNNWAEQVSGGENTSGLEFTGGNPAELKMQLFFDTHTKGTDVRTQYVNKLWKLALVDSTTEVSATGKKRPPICEFRWGQAWSFKCVVTSISTKFDLFLSDGTPTRATVDLSLKQAQDEGSFPAQNPTSGGIAGHRTHTVLQRETLDIIAAKEYGESRHWRHIAKTNGIDNPLAVRPGMVLTLPPIEDA